MKPAYIFIHTAGFDGNADAATIRRWHLERGWTDIGYHRVIRRDGSIEDGRSLQVAGAHVFGVNARSDGGPKSLGVCCEGNGDREDFTEEQKRALAGLCTVWMDAFDIPLHRVLGHHEVNDLVEAGTVPATINGKSVRTGKTCPGTKVDMDDVRQLIALYGVIGAIRRPAPDTR